MVVVLFRSEVIMKYLIAFLGGLLSAQIVAALV